MGVPQPFDLSDLNPLPALIEKPGVHAEGFSVAAVRAADPIAHALARYQNSKMPDHQHLCAVQAALASVITEQGLEPTATAYFAAAMTALERELADNPITDASNEGVRTAILSLLALALPRTPPAVLRPKMDTVLGYMVTAVGKGEEKGGGAAGTGNAKAGLQCIQYLIQAADKTKWLSLARGFGMILNHAVDSRPKVRKRAQLCLVEIFADLQSTPALAFASDTVVTLSETLMAAALNPQPPTPKRSKKELKAEARARMQEAEDGEAGEAREEGREGATPGARSAVVAMHMLGGLKQILALLSAPAIARLLLRLCELHNLHHPILSIQVLDTLGALCRSPTAAVTAAALGDMLTQLLSQQQEGGGGRGGREAAEMRAFAQVVQSAFERVHELDPALCAKKLPLAFLTLTGCLGSEQEEVVFVTAECLRGLISTTISPAMVEEGVRRVGGGAPSGIERMIAALEATLQYQLSSAWDMALLLTAAMFDVLGPASGHLMAGTVRTLGQLQELADEDMKCRKQLHTAIGAAIAAMGAARFLEILPLQMEDADLSAARVWLLPLLRTHMVGGTLAFFHNTLLPLAASLRARALKAAADERPVAAKNAEACLVAVWGLLPAACHLATDTAASFARLARPLSEAMKKEAELRPMVCQAIQVIITENRAARGDTLPEAEQEALERDRWRPAEQRAADAYTVEVATANLGAVARQAPLFLPLLFNAFLAAGGERKGEGQGAIAALASITPPGEVKDFFRHVMTRLLEATKAGGGVEARGRLLDLALALIPGLDNAALELLYATAKAALGEEAGLQKRAYKIVARLAGGAEGFVAAHETDLLNCLLAGAATCHSPSKRHRLVCLRHVMQHLLQKGDGQRDEVVQALVAEVVLAVLEVNTRTRSAAYALLVQLPRSMQEAQGEGALTKFFYMLMAGLGGEHPNMIAASVIALARVLYEFSTQLLQLVPALLPTALQLFRHRNRQVVKALLGLVKVVVARLPGEELATHLSALLEGLLLWCNDSKNQFKMKVRVILERLVRRCGHDLVAASMPPNHLKLLTHIRKTKEREQRKKHGGDTEGEDAATAKRSTWRHTDVFSDEEEEEEDAYRGGESEAEEGRAGAGRSKGGRASTIAASSARSMRSRRVSTRLPEDGGMGEEPLDLLDSAKTRMVLSALPSQRRKRAMEGEEEEEVYAEDGRLVVKREGGGGKKQRLEGEEEGEEEGGGRRGAEGEGSRNVARGERKREVKGREGVKGRGVKEERRDSKGWAYTGEEYAAKKGRGGGDVKKEGKLEPHAYWPLDPKMMNRREGKRVAARRGLASVASVGKKLRGMSVKGALKVVGGVQKRRKTQKGHKGAGKGGGRKR